MSGDKPILDENIIHSSIYRARNDINSVIHTHPFWCTVWGLVEEPILSLPVYFTDRFMIEGEQDGKKLVKTLGDGMAVLLRSHGLVTVGKTVEQACTLTASLGENAQKLYYASIFSKVPEPYLNLLLRSEGFSKDTRGGDQWKWYEAQLKKRGIYPER